ncbi:hypothetical protein ABTC99_20735, partial [Acinetobacter baumannii]
INASLKVFSSRIVALKLLEPVIAAVLAAVIFHEHLSPQMIAGSVVLLAALALIMSADSQIMLRFPAYLKRLISAL